MVRASAVIDLGAIADNVARLREVSTSPVMAVVKADAYGHGVDRVAPVARAAGADWLGVALPSEAVALRAAGDSGPLMSWLFTPGDDLTGAVATDVDLSSGAPWSVDAVAAAAARTGRTARLHLKVDTGLGRAGSAPADWPDLLTAALEAQRSGRIRIVGIWSHLAAADEPDKVITHRQLDVFTQALDTAAAMGVHPELRHLGSSGAALTAPETHFDLVRCGIAVYGLSPGPALGTSAELGLRPALRLSAEVANVKRVPAGHGVSYGLRYRAAAATTLALVPLGYADGIPRHGSGRVPVSINGQRFTGSGTIAMDQFVVDVGDAAVRPGDEVLLFGDGAGGTPTADDWAQACGTINYEIVTRLGARVPRSYRGAGNGQG